MDGDWTGSNGLRGVGSSGLATADLGKYCHIFNSGVTDIEQLYRPYSDIGLLQILKQETAEYGLCHVITAGLPTVLAYHAADWAAFYAERLLDDVFGEDEEKMSPKARWWKENLQRS